MTSPTAPLTSRKIKKFCEGELSSMLTAAEAKALQDYLGGLLTQRRLPPRRGGGVDITAVVRAAGIDVDRLKTARAVLRPLLLALTDTVSRCMSGHEAVPAGDTSIRKHRGPKPKAIVEFPVPAETTWAEPNDFGAALRLHARRHGESIYHLYNAVVRPEDGVNRSTLISWGRGARMPRMISSLEILGRIERRYRLPADYFRKFMGNAPRAASGHGLKDVPASERRRLAWHLPEDFNRRSPDEQEEILRWVRTVIISGSTEYRRYQAAASRQRFGMRFSCAQSHHRRAGETGSDREPAMVIDAPPRLNREMADLLSFKTSTFAALGMQRNGIWGEQTAQQKVEHFGLWFGALAASPNSDVQGFGADPERLSFATMIFPQVWDWYLQWRERRRGFFTKWEVDLLAVASALCREETGWLRQTPGIAAHLREINGLVTREDIAAVQTDWSGACDRMYRHARRRIKEIQRVSRVHRDPFEPILTVLEAASPVGEYRKITEEILRRIPDERRYPRPAAEAVRSFLILRLGLHTGLRQKNLRELLLCCRGDLPTPERKLEDMKCGEIRWNPRGHGWEVWIPSAAFKNAGSSFFGAKPFRLILPDLGNLYTQIDAYIARHRERLIGSAADPCTFFVKTAKMTSTNAAYCQNTFYEAWRLTVQRYGIYNPWTKQGAIEGLLPHGPHNVRDVLATHILKQTGSYEQASYAIQDTPEMVAQHYGRFLPQDKAEIAARILNQVWAAA